MGLDLLVTFENGDQDLHHLCSADSYQNIWKPACTELNLELAAVVGGLTSIEGPFRERLLSELEILLNWLSNHSSESPSHNQLATHLHDGLHAIRVNLALGNDVSFC
jgi:hypothetical protein